MESKKLELLIDRAIKNEEDAREFYMGLHEKVGRSEAGEALLFMAKEEEKHREFLVGYKEGRYKISSLNMSDVVDYKIAQYIESPDLDKDMQTKDVYLVAAHRELNSHNFYKNLAQIQPPGEVKDMLLRMAAEELKHKEKVEYLYTNTAFPQTQGG